MDSRHLHYFPAIASHESMSEAAEALHERELQDTN